MGTYLNAALIKQGKSTIAMSRKTGDVVDASTWADLPPCKEVIHLASYTDVRRSWDEPAMCLGQNTLGTLNCLEYCRKNNSRLIFLSSYLYGDPELLPTPEFAATTNANPYALSKHMGEEMVMFYRNSYDVPAIIIRPFNIYGIGMSRHFMIPAIITQAIQECKIELFNFETERDFIHVKDIVSLIVKVVDSEVIDGTYNAGSGKSYSSLAIAKSIANNFVEAIELKEISPNSKVNILKTQANIDRAIHEFGWEPLIDIEMGLAEMVLAYKNSQ